MAEVGHGTSEDPRIIGADDSIHTLLAAWRDWLATPAGAYLLEWEQQLCDAMVADVFGFHALQCSLPELDALRTNRMPDRILALDPHVRVDGRGVPGSTRLAHAAPSADAAQSGQRQVPAGETPDAALSDADGTNPVAAPLPQVATATSPVRPTEVRVERYDDLPFASASVDLVVLPHVLEFAADPHRVLRETARVLRADGRILVTGFNPVSLWGARQLALGFVPPPFLPRTAAFIGVPRLKDWFKLLGFDIDNVRYGCYRPPCRTQAWLDRTAFIEHAGDRWWPICGAAYGIAAVKRVHGIRIIGPSWRTSRVKRASVAVASPNFSPDAAGDPAERVSRTCTRATTAAD